MVGVHGFNGYACPDRNAVDMAKLDKHFFDIGYMDTLSAQQTPIHQLDPRAKLITSLVFMTTVISFGKYEISALIPYFVYPVFLGAMGNFPPLYLLKKKLLLVSPFAVMNGTPGVKGISFRITHGESVAIVGENGAGKSTLLYCI